MAPDTLPAVFQHFLDQDLKDATSAPQKEGKSMTQVLRRPICSLVLSALIYISLQLPGAAQAQPQGSPESTCTITGRVTVGKCPRRTLWSSCYFSMPQARSGRRARRSQPTRPGVTDLTASGPSQQRTTNKLARCLKAFEISYQAFHKQRVSDHYASLDVSLLSGFSEIC